MATPEYHCSRCGALLEFIHAHEPWTPDHWICSNDECGSTYVFFEPEPDQEKK